MRSTVLGIVLVAVLVAAAMGTMPSQSQVPTPGMPPGGVAAADDQMIVVSSVVEDRYQQVAVISPKNNTFAVYHVELATGNIELKCVRNITWDLQINCFNGKKPLPSEIQSILEHR